MYVCVLLTVLISFCAAGEKDEQIRYYYSSLGAKTQADSQLVCVPDESGKYLQPRLKYLFTYDENKRLIKKEALRWNATKDNWICAFYLTFTYTDNTTIAEYASWNNERQEYNDCSERAVYMLNNNQFTSYSYYKRDPLAENWNLEHSCLVNVPSETLWDNDGLLIAETNR